MNAQLSRNTFVIVPMPNSYSRRIASNNSTVALFLRSTGAPHAS